jgi:Bacterial protein of unknown function (DUF916)
VTAAVSRLLGARVGATLLAAACAAAAVGSSPAAAATGTRTWSVQPAAKTGADGRARFDYTLEPGGSVDDHVQVNNFGDAPLKLRVYSHDALNTPEGAFTLLPASRRATAVGAWAGLDEEVTVPARDRVVLPFSLAVPQNATPGDHAGGIVASVSTAATDADGNQVRVDNRVGARIYLRVAGELNPRLEIEQRELRYERSWLPFTTGSVTATYVVRNTGNVRLGGRQTATVAGPFDLGSRTVTLSDLPEVLPGQQVTVAGEAERVYPLGRLTAKLSIQPVAPREQATAMIPPTNARVSVWAVPWSELGVLALIALAAWWAWWRRRRGARRTEALIAEAVAQTRAELRPDSRDDRSSNEPKNGQIDAQATASPARVGAEVERRERDAD